MSAKTEDIKVRVEPRDKLLLEQFAQEDDQPVAVLVRRAIRDYVRARGTKPEQQHPHQFTHVA